jgi:hypothetical protein
MFSQRLTSDHSSIPFKAPDSTLKLGRVNIYLPPVLRIRIHRIHMFLDLLDPDPGLFVGGMDPDAAPAADLSIIKDK